MGQGQARPAQMWGAPPEQDGTWGSLGQGGQHPAHAMGLGTKGLGVLWAGCHRFWVAMGLGVLWDLGCCGFGVLWTGYYGMGVLWAQSYHWVWGAVDLGVL